MGLLSSYYHWVRSLFRAFVRAIFLLILLPHSVWAKEPISFVDITLSQTNYSGKPQINEQDKQYSSLSPSFVVFKRWGSPEDINHTLYTNGLAVLPMSDGVDLGLALPELYYRFEGQPNRVAVSFGRKLQDWSELDRFWDTGIWHPLVRWDASRPIEQGLTGAFFEFNQDNFTSVIMVSGLFLPDQQPNSENVGGKMVSANRWFRAPISTASFEHVSGSVYYDIRKPKVVDVIQQNSYAAMVRFGDFDVGSYLRLSVADKPQNQFHLAADPENILVINLNTISFSAPIYPIVVRQKIYTAETGYKWAYSQMTLAYTLEEFKGPEVDPNWQQTALIDAQYSGLIYKQSLLPLGLKRSKISFSYIQKDEKDEHDKNATIIKGDIEASTSKFQFDRMASVQWTANLIRTYKHEIDADFKYVYSLTDMGEWVQMGVKWRQDRDWIWALSGDVFGVPAGTSANTSFISKFRGNDRIMGSLTYVF